MKKILLVLLAAYFAISAFRTRLFTRLLKTLRRRRYRSRVKYFRELFRALWICRVAVLSIIVGALVFSFSQTQDLFYEVFNVPGETKKTDYYEAITFASLFGVCALIWAICVHSSARWSIDSLAEKPRSKLGVLMRGVTAPRRNLPYSIDTWLPQILGIVCFIIIALSLWDAWNNRYISDTEFDIESAPLAEKQVIIFACVSLAAFALYIFYANYRFDVFNWMMKVAGRGHIRIEREVRKRQAGTPGSNLTSLLGGIASILITAIFFYFIYDPQITGTFGRSIIVPIIIGAWIPTFTLLTWFSYAARIPVVIGIILIGITIAYMREGHVIKPVILATNEKSETKQLPGAPWRPLDIYDAVKMWKAANRCNDKKDCPRPIIVAASGGASRAAFFTATTLGILTDFSCLPEPGIGSLRCTGGANSYFSNVLFAISGVSGGSLGGATYAAMLRNTHQFAMPQPCNARHSKFWFKYVKQKTYEIAGKKSPVSHANLSDGPYGPMLWSECLQKILAEDFLSATAVGFAFRDMIPHTTTDRAALSQQAFSQAFEHYARLLALAPELADPKNEQETKGDETKFEEFGFRMPFGAFAPSKDGPWRPLLILNGTSAQTGRRILTSHLSPITIDLKDKKTRAIFADAYDFHEMFNGERKTVYDCTIDLATAVMNSARFPLISPQGLITAPGLVVKSPSDCGRGFFDKYYPVDRIVDGGYFENYGITSAVELANELKKHDLNAAILIITNEPLDSAHMKRLIGQDLAMPTATDRGPMALSWLLAPIGALYNTRSSRGELQVIHTFKDLSPGIEIAHVAIYGKKEVIEPGLAETTVRWILCNIGVSDCPELTAKNEETKEEANANKEKEEVKKEEKKTRFREVSFSWWLPRATQDFIDFQFASTTSGDLQKDALKKVCDWLGNPDTPRGKAVSDYCKANVEVQFIAPIQSIDRPKKQTTKKN